jgi:hypothetical protein
MSMQDRFALVLPCGLILMLASWALAWSKLAPFCEYAFFPLWLGYVLTLNGVAEYVYGDSLLRRLGAPFVYLFALSVPFWWYFELINATVENWHYVFPRPIGSLEYAIQASVDFSTVIPAVLSTGFLLSLKLRRRIRLRHARPSALTPKLVGLAPMLGIVGLAALPVAPYVAFPLVWIAPGLILEPLAVALGKRSWLRAIAEGDWLPFWATTSGTLATGVVWELWNFYASPKWVYTVPYLGFWKVFEMPIAGYLGYPFFGLVVYSYTVLAVSCVLGRDWDGRLCAEPQHRETCPAKSVAG